MSVGLIVSFLQLSKTFIRPINQVSQQLNSVIMALAGAKRIFELMDQEPEKDNGIWVAMLGVIIVTICVCVGFYPLLHGED